MAGIFAILLLFLGSSTPGRARTLYGLDHGPSNFDVVRFGAVGNGKRDDSKVKAFTAHCYVKILL
ncbi:hypothetical protein AMTR_s00300p00013710 [Amborella trichopoda]|uniref:Uncharacterized protein n=1 Tax=Amborella trichopoda TaxID=13333 RepID=W1PYV4_AMBTC|nr:hypothetical protein AMTR_s00300p00013710 [Amborella trichopoda]